MKVNGGSHVVARGDANRPEAISTGKCRKREGEGGYKTRPYGDTTLVVARNDANRPEAISTGKCSKREGEGGYKTRPYQVVSEPTRGGGSVVAELVSAFGGARRP